VISDSSSGGEQDVISSVPNWMSEYEPVFTFVGAAVSLGLLALLVRLFGIWRTTYTDRINVIEERVKIANERRQQVEEDSAMKEQWQQKEIDRLQNQLSKTMDAGNVTIESLVSGSEVVQNAEDIQKSIRDILSEMRELRVGLDADTGANPELYLELANGHTVTNEWSQAAAYYQKYIDFDDGKWRVYFLMAVAYANSREGSKANLESLRAYGNAIALLPDEIDPNTRARLYIYKGAMLKRMKRLIEAEASVLLGARWATNDYEQFDAKYNLACIYAMLENRKQDMLDQLRALLKNKPYATVILNKKHYFERYWNDEDFKQVLDSAYSS